MNSSVKLFITCFLVILLLMLSSCGNDSYEPEPGEPDWLEIVAADYVDEDYYEDEPEDEPDDEPGTWDGYDPRQEYEPPPPLTHLWPVPIKMDSGTISAGGAASFVIQPDGSLWGWGYNLFGFFHGMEASRHFFWPEFMMDDVTWVSTGPGHSTLIIQTDGSLWGCA